MSGPASTDTEMWEVPPASATAGAAAASEWSQAAPAVPQPLPQSPPPPPPAAYQPPPAAYQPPSAQPAPPPPAQSWQQPPPAQQWQQPPQQGWQQPQQPWQQQQYQQPYGQAYGQQAAYGQQSAYGQQWSQAPAYGTSPLAAFAGLLLVVFGFVVIGLGLFTLTQGVEIARFIRDNDIKIMGSLISRDTLRTLLTPSPGALIFVGVVQLTCGVGVMNHKSWGRWLGVLLAAIGLIVTVFTVSIALAIAGGFTVPVIIGVVLLVGYALIVVALIAGGSHFRRKTAVR